MADLLRKSGGSVVIMVGRGGAEPHYVHNWPLYFRGRSAINLITNLLHRGPLFCTYFAWLSHFKMAPLLAKILTSLFLGWSENNLYYWIERKILWFILKNKLETRFIWLLNSKWKILERGENWLPLTTRIATRVAMQSIHERKDADNRQVICSDK